MNWKGKEKIRIGIGIKEKKILKILILDVLIRLTTFKVHRNSNHFKISYARYVISTFNIQLKYLDT